MSKLDILNKLKSIVGLTLLLMLTLVNFNIVHASSSVEVDLSNLSGSGSELSHNHILEDNYDNTYHWQECVICKNEFNKESHTTQIKYTISADSCDTTNRKITSCTKCLYYTSVPYSKAHTPKTSLISWVDINTMEQYISLGCEKCNAHYNRSNNGYNWYIKSAGKLADVSTLNIPNTLTDNKGITKNLTFKTESCTWNDPDIVYTYNITGTGINRTINATVTYKIPANMQSKYTSNQITNDTYVRPRLWVWKLAKGYENNGLNLEPTSRSYNATTKTLTCKYTFTLKSNTANYNNTGYFRGEIRYLRYPISGNTSNFYTDFYCSKSENLSVNHYDVTVSSYSIK